MYTHTYRCMYVNFYVPFISVVLIIAHCVIQIVGIILKMNRLYKRNVTSFVLIQAHHFQKIHRFKLTLIIMQLSVMFSRDSFYRFTGKSFFFNIKYAHCLTKGHRVTNYQFYVHFSNTPSFFWILQRNPFLLCCLFLP